MNFQSCSPTEPGQSWFFHQLKRWMVVGSGVAIVFSLLITGCVVRSQNSKTPDELMLLTGAQLAAEAARNAQQAAENASQAAARAERAAEIARNSRMPIVSPAMANDLAVSPLRGRHEHRRRHRR